MAPDLKVCGPIPAVKDDFQSSLWRNAFFAIILFCPNKVIVRVTDVEVQMKT